MRFSALRTWCVWGLALLAVAGCDKKPAAGPTLPATPAPTAWTAPLSIGPITFYQDHCAQCHGVYGDPARKLSPDDEIHPIMRETLIDNGDEKYRGVVVYMISGPSQTSLGEAETDALTAYCRAVALGKGFVATIEPGPGPGIGLEGEVTPGSTVRLVMGEMKLDAKVDGHRWSIDKRQVDGAKSQAGEKWLAAKLVTNRAGAETTLPLTGPAFMGPPAPKK